MSESESVSDVVEQDGITSDSSLREAQGFRNFHLTLLSARSLSTHCVDRRNRSAGASRGTL
jgi:hypothetical protein